MSGTPSLPEIIQETGPWKEETDTVEARFGGEFSENTLDLMRRYQKPEWMEEDSSLDPVSEMDDYATHSFRLPPRTYDAMQEAAGEVVAELRARRDERLAPDDERLVQYRKQLVEGTSVDDVKLLKLRAYYRAMDKLRERDAQARSPEVQQQLMQLHGVPLDKVPQELLDLTPEQLADRWQSVQAEAAATAAGGAAAASATATAAADRSSEDSEWDADWASTSYLDNEATRRELQAAFVPARPFRVGLSLRKPTRGGEEGPPPPHRAFGATMEDGDPDRWQQWAPVYGHTAEYLQEQRLEKRLRAQQRQRALAFWVPLATVLGAYVVKGVRRLMRGGGGAKKGGGGAKGGAVAGAKGTLHVPKAPVQTGRA